jgi:hypothetical protein
MLLRRILFLYLYFQLLNVLDLVVPSAAVYDEQNKCSQALDVGQSVQLWVAEQGLADGVCLHPLRFLRFPPAKIEIQFAPKTQFVPRGKPGFALRDDIRCGLRGIELTDWLPAFAPRPDVAV